MSSLKNAKRYKTIIEMEDKEKGYINERSLAFYIDQKTKEAIYILFHFDTYSNTKHISNYEPASTFDTEIICTYENGVQNFQVTNQHAFIGYYNISDKNKDTYTILTTSKARVNIFDAIQDDLELDELSDALDDFIENILEQEDDEENSDTDEKYFDSWYNFSDVILELSNKDNQSEIETILCNIALIASNDINKNQILDNLSDRQKCMDYLISLSKQKMQGHIEQTILEEISGIIGISYEIFIKSSQDKGNSNIIGDDNQKKINDLKNQLFKAIEDEEFEKADKIKNDLLALGVNMESK